MDPNATLAAIDNALTALEDSQREADRTDTDPAYDPDRVADLMEAVRALDGWLTNGGFTPDRWTR